MREKLFLLQLLLKFYNNVPMFILFFITILEDSGN